MLYEEFTIMALTAFDAENHFKAIVTGIKREGLNCFKKFKPIMVNRKNQLARSLISGRMCTCGPVSVD